MKLPLFYANYLCYNSRISRRWVSQYVCLSICLSVCLSVCLSKENVRILGKWRLLLLLIKIPSPHLPEMFTTCFITGSRHVHGSFTTCSWQFHNLFTTCSRRVHDMFTAYSQPVHDMSTTYSRHVHDMFVSCSPHIQEKKLNTTATSQRQTEWLL